MPDIITKRHGRLIVEGMTEEVALTKVVRAIVLVDILDDTANELSTMFSKKDRQMLNMFKRHFQRTHGAKIAEFFDISYEHKQVDLEKFKEEVEFLLKKNTNKLKIRTK